MGGFIAIEERQRLLLGAAKPLPGVRRRAPVARDLERVGRGCLLLALSVRPPLRQSQIATSPWYHGTLEMRRCLEATLGLGHTAGEIPL